jgi:hypothetical protein
MVLKTTRMAALLLGLWMALEYMPVAFAAGQDVAVVINDSNSVKNLSMGELRKILNGERGTWPGGVPVKLFVRAPGTYERIVLLRLLGMSESEYKQYWTSQVFRGEAQAEPIVLPSNGMQKEAVVTFPGAIALMVASDVKSPLKMVKLEGHLPGEAGYPLH